MSLNVNQKLALDKFSKLKVGALFMQMGSGKTRVALELARNNLDDIDLVLYVTPYSTKTNLESEIAKWSPDLPVKVIGYETISSSDAIYLRLLEEIQGKRLMIIADESTFIKNDESKRHKRLLELRKHADFALILNGTPITKDEFDIYNQMQFLSPKIIGMDRNEFRNTFFKKITYKKRGKKEAKSFYKLSEVNIDYLKKLIEPYVFESKLDFKLEETESVELVYPDAETSEKYADTKRSLMRSLERMDGVLLHLTTLAALSACDKNKAKKVAQYAKGKQVIVYCQYIYEALQIRNEIDCYYIDGSVKNRDEVMKQFKNDSKPLVITFGTGSFGLNLQYANEIVYSSAPYDYGKLEQSRYRIKRLGQERAIKYTYFKTNLGIQSLIDKSLQKKSTLHKLVEANFKKGDTAWVKNI